MFYRVLDCRCVIVDTKLEIVPARLKNISLSGEKERESKHIVTSDTVPAISAKMVNG